ncbi:hypothetical protein GGR34_003719 [Microvirga flocculans]|uniref:Zinc finger CHC2-type domain-containing protein n=1 Tax=Microvirga flocculans TaxID=217168 RepID=A0A7W6IIC3_9HYPH|nr:CHC2 zinc finger domain-containing protein [Microvirga flocculans]MBB4042034.1 hypothetical protein [Microvirga flocculans]
MPRGKRDLAFEDWVHDAKSVPILQAALERGARLKGGREKVGPCPACGGRDRFSVNTVKAIFHCRGSGQGGDVIALVQYLDGVDFLGACERLTGRPPPQGESTIDHAELARKAEERRADAEKQERRSRWFREQERKRLYDMWKAGVPVEGTPVEAYLAMRQVVLPPRAAVRCLMEAKLYASHAEEATVIHTGPAMMAAIVGPEERFVGLHLTWIDLTDPEGKARVVDPKTGEVEAAKKMRGSTLGGRIELVRCENPRVLVLGEGIEEVLTVHRALTAAGWDLSRTAFWTALNLGNLGGPHRGTVEHPTHRRMSRDGRDLGPQKVPGDVPDLTQPAIPVPDSVEELFLLGDGDSDHFTTDLAMRRAARRYARKGRIVRVVWSPAGGDWNKLLRAAA